jgi:hypothetical protein
VVWELLCFEEGRLGIFEERHDERDDENDRSELSSIKEIPDSLN